MNSQNFRRDERGSVAIIFVIAAVGLMAVIAVAIDYTRLITMQTKLQMSADTAILTVVPGYTEGQISKAMRDQATSSVEASMMGAHARSHLKSGSNGQLCMTVSVEIPLLMQAKLGSRPVSATSCAANNATYEIALALDNTGSMAESAGGQSKLQALQVAATGLVQAMNPNPAKPNAAISVVPFASAVNVGASYFYSSGAEWLDRYGQSSIHWQNYTRPAGASWTPASRFDLFAAMGAQWGGCVEERPAPYLTTDTQASQARPDTLFAPYLAPDDAGGAVGEACYAFTPTAKYPATPYAGGGACAGKYVAFNTYLDDAGGACAANDLYAGADAADPVSAGSGATKVCKYKGQSVAAVNSAISGVNGGTGIFPAGPNLGCSIAPLQPLTTDMTRISGSAGVLTAMKPNGDTALLPGFMWGWRTISPNGPFTSGGGSIGPQKPKAYGLPTNTKIIVLMTDGFDHWVANPYSPYQSIYSALGFFVNNRVAQYGSSAGPTTAANYRAQMDAALLEACANARNVGVQIYTVGFSVPDKPIDAAGLDALKRCATQPANAYIAQDAGAIVATFKTIADSILTRRLTR